MNNRHAVAATVTGIVTVTVAATAACSTPVPGTPIASEHGTVTGTSTVTTTAAPAQQSRWVFPTWTGKVNAEAIAGHQWSAIPIPGAATLHHSPDGGTKYQTCTIGPAISDAGGSPGFLTAGHCTKQSEQFVIDSQSGTIALYGSGSPALTNLDAASVSAPVTAAVTRIADRFPIAGVLTAKAAAALDPGTPICLDGAASGVTCGTVVSNPGSLAGLTTSAIGVPGDSGAAVFVIDAAGNAALVGLHNGGDASTSTVVLLEPVLDALNADVIIDRGTAPATGDDFSTRTQVFTS